MITSIYLQGIDSAEIIDTVHGRPAPMVPVDTSACFRTPCSVAGAYVHSDSGFRGDQ
jgi:hypothetical protein